MIDKLKKRMLDHQPVRFRSNQPQAGVLVALTDDPDPEVILTQRAARLSTHGGEVAFPGGKFDDTDPDLEFTALREAHEEVGLDPAVVNVIGRLGQVMSKHRLQVTPFVAVVDPSSLSLVPNPGELDAVFRVPVSFLLAPEHYQLHQIHAEGMIHNVPAWRYEQHVIWGLTAYILAELLNVAFDADIPLKARPEHQR